MRLKLQSTAGDGTKLEFTAHGEGIVEISLNTSVSEKYQVLGTSDWEIVSEDLVRVYLNGLGQHQIQVLPTDNILPLIKNTQLSSDWNKDIAFQISASDFDGTADSIQIKTQPANGTVVFNGLQGIYTPNPDFFGKDSISVVAIDNEGGLSLPGTIDIIIQRPNTADGLANYNIMNRHFVLDGEFEEWDALELAASDPIDANNPNDKLDFRNVTLAHNEEKFFIGYTSELPAPLNWGHNIFIDLDANLGTGYQYWFVGGDVLIQGGNFYQYLGGGTDWNWQKLPVSQVATNSSMTQFEIAIDRNALGSSQYCKMVFLADNRVYSGSSFDFVPDGFTSNAEIIEYYFVNPNGNFAPSATPDSRVILTNSSLDLNLSGIDRESSDLSFQIVTQPSSGTLNGTAPAVSYTPNSGFSGNDYFEFIVSDGELNSEPARVDVSIIEFPAEGVFSNDGSQVFLDGDLTDWKSLTLLPSDSSEVLDSESGIDWKNAYIAHDETSLFFAIDNYYPITLNWGLMVFIDSDQNQETGFKLSQVPGYGFDLMVQAAGIFQYAGTGVDWKWNLVGFTDRGVNGNIMEFRVPTNALINLQPSATVDIVFYGDNAAFGSSAGIDLHPDAGSSFGAVWSYTLSHLNQQTFNNDQPIQISGSYNHTLSVFGNLPEALNPSLMEELPSKPIVLKLKILSEPRKVWKLQKSNDLKAWESIFSWKIYGNESQTILPPDTFNEYPNHLFLRGISPVTELDSGL